MSCKALEEGTVYSRSAQASTMSGGDSNVGISSNDQYSYTYDVPTVPVGATCSRCSKQTGGADFSWGDCVHYGGLRGGIPPSFLGQDKKQRKKTFLDKGKEDKKEWEEHQKNNPTSIEYELEMFRKEVSIPIFKRLCSILQGSPPEINIFLSIRHARFQNEPEMDMSDDRRETTPANDRYGIPIYPVRLPPKDRRDQEAMLDHFHHFFREVVEVFWDKPLRINVWHQSDWLPSYCSLITLCDFMLESDQDAFSEWKLYDYIYDMKTETPSGTKDHGYHRYPSQISVIKEEKKS